MRKLTDLQRKTLEYIRTFTREHGYPPARKELMAGLGVRNKSVIDQRLSALRDKGWLELGDGRHRSLRLLCEELPLIVAGTVAAGEPILAEDRITHRIPRSVAEAFRCQPDYFLRVEGDSMDRLGFFTGSVVAIRAQSTAEHGEVIVARIGDQVTLKRYPADRRAAGRAPTGEHESRAPADRGGPQGGDVRDLRGRGGSAARGRVQRS